MDWNRYCLEKTDFYFGHIQPGSVNGGVVDFQALCDLSGYGRLKGNKQV